METPLVDGKVLAEALGVSGAALSVAVREDRPCKNRPVHRWAERKEKTGGQESGGGEGPVRGYAVPRHVRIELGLPPFEALAEEDPPSEGGPPSEGDSPLEERSTPKEPGEEVLREAARWLVTKVAARVAFSVHEEMGPWLREAIRARIEAGEWPPAWAEPETEGKEVGDGEAEDGEPDDGEPDDDEKSASAAEEKGGFRLDLVGPVLAAGLGNDPPEEDTDEGGPSRDGPPKDGPSGDGERE